MRPPANHRERRIDREVMKLELRQARERAQALQQRPPGPVPPARARPR
jgi:hypothetical protein